MKHLLLVLFIFLSGIWLNPNNTAPIESESGFHNRIGPAEGLAPQSGAVLCLPGIYWQDPQDCQPLGPSAYLTKMARLGLTFPPQPLPATRPDPALSYVPFAYARLKEEPTPIYTTLDDAIAGANPAKTIDQGQLKFISYINTADTGGSEKPDFFELRAGGWVGGVSGRLSAVPAYQGLIFSRTPDRPFGWITPISDNVETRRTPGFNNEDFTGHKLSKYEVVQIYATQPVGELDWYMVGPDEWIEQTTVGRVLPNTAPPQGITATRWIEINLFEQTLAVYADSRLVFATLIASGIDGFWTRPGTFQIYKKLESTLMAGAFEFDRSDFYYLEDVPWTMYYDDARALHGAYWRTAFGFQQSHGCVNLSPGDAHWLFDWAGTGDWVYVWDSSGQTPTDSATYEGLGAP